MLDELTLPDGQRLEYAEARRNVVTRGIDLNTLVGQRFRVGDVECVGRRLCEPCAHLERLTHKGVLRNLIHRGGLRADILTAGSITVGAAIELADGGRLSESLRIGPKLTAAPKPQARMHVGSADSATSLLVAVRMFPWRHG